MNNTFKSTWTSVIALILFFLINAALVWVSLNFLIGYSLTPLASLRWLSGKAAKELAAKYPKNFAFSEVLASMHPQQEDN
jgi:hypothetical protein